METMATSTTTGFYVQAPSPAITTTLVGARHRRQITPRAGHALEILGHAIEYLTDEMVHEGLSSSGNSEQVKAIQLLMALNRQVYFECPEIPTFSERCRSFLHL
jgi:hypothetical protein